MNQNTFIKQETAKSNKARLSQFDHETQQYQGKDQNYYRNQ